MMWVTRCRSLSIACILGRRRSMKRYFSRVLSSTSISSETSKGGVRDLFRTTILVAESSTVPVGSSGFSAPGRRLTIFPVICTTHSDRRLPASSWAASEYSGLKTTWSSPERSRRSIKIRLPWSRRRWTQPATVMSDPTVDSRGSPQFVSLYTVNFLFVQLYKWGEGERDYRFLSAIFHKPPVTAAAAMSFRTSPGMY